jgi:hypothetical protein
MKIKAIIAAILLSPFYVIFVITGLLLTILFAFLIRIMAFLGFIDGLSLLFHKTSGILKRFNMRKVKIS